MDIKLVNLAVQDRELQEEILQKIQDVIAHDSFILGKEVTSFEESFASMSNARYAIGCSSGTDALMVALKALGIGPGDEVITVPNTFIATSEAISAVGARVVFSDIDYDSLLMDPVQLESKISSRTKAIIPVHLHGNPAEIHEIMEVATHHGIRVVFDAAQAHIAQYHGRGISEYGDFCTYSFFPGKTLGAYGDAGALTTNDPDLAQKARMLVNHGRTTMSDKYKHLTEGFNCRLDTLQAGILNVKLKKLPSWTQERIAISGKYKQLLSDIPEVVFPAVKDNRRHVFHLVVIRAQDRDKLLVFLSEKGIQAGVHYPIPLHLQPAYGYLGYEPGDFPRAEQLAGEILSLPTYPGLTDDEIRYIASSIRDYYQHRHG